MMPTLAKEKFLNRFPNIEISSKEINQYIRSIYRQVKKLHSEKIKNTKTIFKLADNNNIIISESFKYENEDENPKTFNLVMIANDKMINNIKDNQINQFFFNFTYKIVPPNKHKLN